MRCNLPVCFVYHWLSVLLGSCVQIVCNELLCAKKKAATNLFVTAWFPLFYALWTSLGLNQGPPDYESVALTNWATSPMHPCLDSEDKSSIFYWNMQDFWIKFLITFVLRTYKFVLDSWETSLFSLVLPARISPWWSRTRKMQRRPKGRLSWCSPYKGRQWCRRCRVKGKSTSTWCPNNIRLSQLWGETSRWWGMCRYLWQGPTDDIRSRNPLLFVISRGK